MKYIIIAAVLAGFSLVGCGGGKPSQALPTTEKEAYERITSGQKLECEFGIDANGKCLKEGEDPRPYGGKGKEGH